MYIYKYISFILHIIYLPSVLIHVLPFINHLKITLKVQTDSRACRIYFSYKVLFLRKKTKK